MIGSDYNTYDMRMLAVYASDKPRQTAAASTQTRSTFEFRSMQAPYRLQQEDQGGFAKYQATAVVLVHAGPQYRGKRLHGRLDSSKTDGTQTNAQANRQPVHQAATPTRSLPCHALTSLHRSCNHPAKFWRLPLASPLPRNPPPPPSCPSPSTSPLPTTVSLLPTAASTAGTATSCTPLAMLPIATFFSSDRTRACAVGSSPTTSRRAPQHSHTPSADADDMRAAGTADATNPFASLTL